MDITLADIIRQYVNLPAVPNSKGWYPVVHSACDHGRKGPRAAFKLDGDSVGFHCFNCKHVAKYDPSEHPYLSKNMKQVMEDFGIPESEYQKPVFAALASRGQESNSENKKEEIINLEPEILNLPKTFYDLKDADDAWGDLARYYLEEERGVNVNSQTFYLAHKTDDPYLKKWFGRVIIPIYKDGNLIFYIGRDLTGKKTKKYESPSVSRDTVIYGYDRLFADYEKPLYVAEGWFDAFAVDGAAILGNEINATKAKIFNRSRRQKVYIPDRFGNGRQAAEQALEYGWSISTPNIGDCKDMNEAVLKYGKLYVLKTLAENTVSDSFSANVKLRIFCEE